MVVEIMRRAVSAVVRYFRRRAEAGSLGHLSDYQLKDFGLFRYQIGTGLDEEVARARCRQQQIKSMDADREEACHGCVEQ